jgi:hypothetical protein
MRANANIPDTDKQAKDKETLVVRNKSFLVIGNKVIFFSYII